jgi:anhydro-N-acetylmuramic acid kinase
MTPLNRHPIIDAIRRNPVRVLGINSGTSVDGLDGALVEMTQKRGRRECRVIRTFSRAFPPTMREAILRASAADRISKQEVVQMQFALGRFIGRTATRWMRQCGRVDLIASHGQTVAHYPFGARKATWQIGTLNEIAQMTGQITIGDFRPADIAAGGMGAPLSGYYHHLIFGAGVPVLNIGGLANISVSRMVRGRLSVTAFDSGPGNMLIDALSERLLDHPFDRNGHAASRGKADARAVNAVLAHPYFRLSPPKTCGREEFGWGRMRRIFAERGLAPVDALATAVEVTAWSIADATRKWIAPKTEERALVISGGGGRNAYLLMRLQEYLGDWQLTTPDGWGVPARYLESVGFAALGIETLHARAGNLGGATGAKRPAVLGLIALPLRRGGLRSFAPHP